MAAGGLRPCYLLSIHFSQPISHGAWWGGQWGEDRCLTFADCIHLFLQSPDPEKHAVCHHSHLAPLHPPLQPSPWALGISKVPPLQVQARALVQPLTPRI